MRFNEDNVINAFCIFAMVATTCVILVLILKLFFGQQIDIGFVKDIFSIGSTLAAALIAVALFSDWKEQHNKQIIAAEAKDVFKIFHNQRDILHNVKFKYKDYLNSLEEERKKISWNSEANAFEKDFLSIYNKDKNDITEFCYLTEEHDVFIKMQEYSNNLKPLVSILDRKRAELFSESNFLDEKDVKELLDLIIKIQYSNKKILDQLRTYIFF